MQVRLLQKINKICCMIIGEVRVRDNITLCRSTLILSMKIKCSHLVLPTETPRKSQNSDLVHNCKCVHQKKDCE